MVINEKRKLMRILMLSTIAMMIFGFSTMTQAAGKMCDKCHTRKPSESCESGYTQNGDLCCQAVKCNTQRVKKCDRCMEKAKKNDEDPQECYDLCH